ncbi:MAG: ABC transporter substrate-binding protein [Candidatus Sumerlaeota bacterium]|nr:ABC transporter substrate-binding protein [Candidatus Sumerlaeota bacterium]
MRSIAPTLMRARALAVFPCAAFVWLLAGCNRETPSGGPVAVEFWHAMSGESGRLLDELAREFNAANSDLLILPRYQGSYSQFSQKLMAAVIARTNPPLAQVYSHWATRFMELERLRPIEDFFAGPFGLTPDEIDDFFPAFLNDNQWSGRTWTLPFNKSAYVAYYNLDLLRAAGFEQPPATWDDFRRAAGAMTEREGDQTAVFGFAIRPRLEIFTAFFYGADGRYLGPDGRSPALGLDAAATLALLTDMIQKEKTVRVDDDYPEGPFAAGRTACFLSTSATMTYVAQAVAGRFAWAVAALPTPDGKPAAVLFQGTNIGIFANHPEPVQQGAWRFTRFLVSPRTTARWAIGSGYLPVRRLALADPELQAFAEANANFRVALDQIPRARFEPKPDWWDRYRRAAQEQVAECLYGRATPTQTLEKMRESMKEMIGYSQPPGPKAE